MNNDLNQRVKSIENELKIRFPSEDLDGKIIYRHPFKELYFSIWPSSTYPLLGGIVFVEYAYSKEELYSSPEEGSFFRMDMMTLPAMLGAICEEVETKALILPKCNKIRFILRKDEIDELKRHAFPFDVYREYDEDEAYDILQKAFQLEAGLVENDAESASRIAHIVDRIDEQIDAFF